jgi:hypothetical protein
MAALAKEWGQAFDRDTGVFVRASGASTADDIAAPRQLPSIWRMAMVPEEP